MKVIEVLKGVNAYPLPLRTIREVAELRGINPDEDSVAYDDKSIQLAKADLLVWLSYAPDVAQGGQSFSFTDEQRKQFRAMANAIYRRNDDAASETYDAPIRYGYKGSRL